MAEEKITYTKAYEELKQIISDMEQSEVSVDELDIKIRRASQLLKICKDRLYQTEENVKEVLKEIEEYQK